MIIMDLVGLMRYCHQLTIPEHAAQFIELKLCYTFYHNCSPLFISREDSLL